MTSLNYWALVQCRLVKRCPSRKKAPASREPELISETNPQFILDRPRPIWLSSPRAHLDAADPDQNHFGAEAGMDGIRP
jgi:hypothetical protein